MPKVTITPKVEPVGILIGNMEPASYGVVVFSPDGFGRRDGSVAFRPQDSNCARFLDDGTYASVTSGYRVRPLVPGDKITIEI